MLTKQLPSMHSPNHLSLCSDSLHQTSSCHSPHDFCLCPRPFACTGQSVSSVRRFQDLLSLSYRNRMPLFQNHSGDLLSAHRPQGPLQRPCSWRPLCHNPPQLLLSFPQSAPSLIYYLHCHPQSIHCHTRPVSHYPLLHCPQ